jgi:hypothetical protein
VFHVCRDRDIRYPLGVSRCVPIFGHSTQPKLLPGRNSLGSVSRTPADKRRFLINSSRRIPASCVRVVIWVECCVRKWLKHPISISAYVKHCAPHSHTQQCGRTSAQMLQSAPAPADKRRFLINSPRWIPASCVRVVIWVECCVRKLAKASDLLR